MPTQISPLLDSSTEVIQAPKLITVDGNEATIFVGETVRYADLEMDLDAMEVHRGDREIRLTALEFALLEYFVRNARIVLSRSRIREAVWDLDADTSSNVVDVYVRYLRQKIETDDAPPLLHTVRGAGYVLK